MTAAASSRYPYYALFVLTAVNAVAYLDRQITAVLLQPIKLELHLTDTQLGVLSGVTFALFYATMGVPIAMLADRTHRRNIVAGALTLFSAMTMACGLAANFWQLALARVFVGVGEGGTGPPIHSIIADLFPVSRRATAVAVYGVGINVGILLGFLIGGWVAQIYGWRAAFLVAGAPGLVLAAVVFLTIREPVRGASDGASATSATAAPPLLQTVRRLFSRASYRHLVIGGTLYSLAAFALLTWSAAFFARTHGMRPGEIGTVMALLLGIVGAAGTFSSGWTADRLGRRDARWIMWAPGVALLIFGAGASAALLAPEKSLALLLFAIPAFVVSAHVGPCSATTQTLAPLRMRVTSSALFMFAVNLVGMAGGALVVGVLSDLYAPRFGDDALRYAILTALAVVPWGALHFYWAGRGLREDMAFAQAEATATA